MADKAKDRAKQLAKITRLKTLAEDATEQTAYALELLEEEKNSLVLEAALRVLEENYTAAAHPLLHKLYQYLSTDATKRDSGASLRVLVIKALRPILKQSDIPLLEQASATYEFLPPNREESAMSLRAMALVALSDVDEGLTAYHCVRILVDPYTSNMSGEPAVTAARVLADQSNFLPLYQYIFTEQKEPNFPEVVAECLKGLTRIPDSLLGRVVSQFQLVQDEVILIGLFDLVLGHKAGANFNDFLLDFLATTTNYDLYRYLTLTIITSGKKDSTERILANGKESHNKPKLETLIEVLSLTNKHDQDVKILAEKLKKA